MTQAMMRKLMQAVMKLPYLTGLRADVEYEARRSPACRRRRAMSGLMMSSTSDLVMAENAAPMMTATARSITLPRRMKSRNPLNIWVSDEPYLVYRSLPPHAKLAVHGTPKITCRPSTSISLRARKFYRWVFPGAGPLTDSGGRFRTAATGNSTAPT